MKPNDKAIEAALAEGRRWTVNSSWDMTFRVIREEDGVRDKIAEFNNREERDEALERLRAEAMLNAAFIAQFQSEDYAGLIERLKTLACELASVHDAVGEKFVEINEAADAIEALLAERDALKSELIDYKDAAASEADFVNEQGEKIKELKAERDAARQEISEWMVKFQELFDRPNASYNERWDAIFCRLVSRGMDHSYAAYIADQRNRRLVSAPVDDEKLVKIALQQYKRVYNDTHVTRAAQQRTSISAAIAAIRPHIEAAERERCAKIAESHKYPMKSIAGTGYNNAANEIAAAIRSGK